MPCSHMCRYADEDSSFAIELTYNYNVVRSYDVGNDFCHLVIKKKSVFESVSTSVSILFFKQAQCL